MAIEKSNIPNNTQKGSNREKAVRFGSWKELLKAIPGYERLGYSCEVKGWEGMTNNTLIIREAEQ
ncbi:MAG: hypothetical protein J5961_04050 [Mogibacterium sp.]|nr:hypothetical protein [Mogibacterium sp.]